MADDDKEARFLRLPRGTWWYVLSLYVPLTVVDLLTHVMRLRRSGVPLASLELWESLRLSLAFGLATILFWLVVLSVVRSRGGRVVVAIALHGAFTLLSAIVVLNALYFLKADIVLNLYSLELVPLLFDTHIAELVAAEVPIGLVAGGLALLVLVNAVPPLLNRWWQPRWLWQVPDQAAVRLVRPGAVLVVLAVLVGLAVLPDGTGGHRANRSRVVDIGVEAVATATDDDDEVEVSKADLPRATSLVGDPSPNRHNVVLILVESLRAASTSVHDDDLHLTPRLDELARSAIVADRAYTVLPHTTKALITAHCGVAPPLETYDATGTEGVMGRCLPELLDEQGYATAYFQSATGHFEERDQVVEHFGFDEFHPLEALETEGFSKVNGFGYEDDIMVEPSLDWAGRQDRPFLLSYLTVTTHYDYTLPKGFAEEELSSDPVENRYLNAVRYSDRFVGKVLDGFKRAGLYDDTVFIVTGDHGEAFYEHGRRSHNDVIWSEGIQVPLIISTPESRAASASRIERPVQLTALLPTIADVLGFRVEGTGYDQPSMLAEDDEDLYAVCWDQKQCVSVIRGDHKYNHFFGYRPDEWFDVAADPAEKENLIDELSDDEVDELRHAARRWMERVQARYALARSLD